MKNNKFQKMLNPYQFLKLNSRLARVNSYWHILLYSWFITVSTYVSSLHIKQ